MALQILPPDISEDKISTKEPQAYWKPSSLGDGESEEFRLHGCYGTGHAVTGWQYASEVKDSSTGETRFNGYVITRSYPDNATDLARETDWSHPDRPKIEGTFVKPKRFLAWVASSASRGRLEILFIEQKSLREQLTDVLKEVDDFTWTNEGLANFSIKITRKGVKLETSYQILAKIRPVSDAIKKQWDEQKETIWLPNFFEGKDPFDGKQVEEKGLPAGGTDARGATVLPKKSKKKVASDADF